LSEMTLSQKAEFVWDVATGAKRDELEALRQDLTAQRKMIDEMTAKVQAMPQGPQRDAAHAIRTKAYQAWMPIVRQFDDAAIEYEKIRQKVITASVGMYDPGPVSTRLAFPAALVWIPIVAVSAGFAIMTLASLIDSIKSNSTQVRGYMDQFASVLQGGANVLEQTGGVIVKSTWALLAVAGVAAAVIVFKTWKGAKKAVTP